MSIKCPKCKTEIAPDDFNVAANVAYCRACRTNFEYASLVSAAELLNVDLNNPPKYFTLEADFDENVLVFKKVPKITYFFIFFMLIWSGGSMTMMFKSIADSGFTIDTLFFLPFLVGTIGFGIAILLGLFGSRKITSNLSDVEIFYGLGSVGLRKKYLKAHYKSVSLEYGQISSNDQPLKDIRIQLEEGYKDIRFGAFIDEECKKFLAGYIDLISKSTE